VLHGTAVQCNAGGLVLSPTDLTKHLGCAHITTLDLLRLDDGAEPPATDDALELVFRLGLAHEAAYLQSLKDQGLTVASIEPVNGEVRGLEAAWLSCGNSTFLHRQDRH
jgi:hypothetical protein